MRVKYDTEVSDGCGEGNDLPGKRDGYGGSVDLVRGANMYDFSFGAVQLQEVVLHPRLYLLQTGDDGGGKVAERCESIFMYSCVSSA